MKKCFFLHINKFVMGEINLEYIVYFYIIIEEEKNNPIFRVVIQRCTFDDTLFTCIIQCSRVSAIIVHCYIFFLNDTQLIS